MEVNEDKTREFYGWIAAILSIFSLFIPFGPFIKLMNGKTNFKNSPAFYVTTAYISNVCWYIYGDLISSKQIKYINCFSAIFNIILIFIYLYYEIKVYPIDSVLNGLIIIIGSYALHRGLVTIVEDKDAVGNICMGTQFVSLLSPLVLIVKVIKKKNYNLIPIYLIWIYLSSSISWVAYGVFLVNIYIICPNIVAFFLGIILIIIYVVYRNKYEGIIDFNSSQTLDIEANEKNEGDEITTITIDEDVEKKNKKPKPVKIVNSKEDN